MPQDHKTVFISYRISVAAMGARAIYQSLTPHGYDVFLDVEGLDPGSFSQQLLHQIAARAHFLPVLSPGTLERCKNPDDWVLREIQEAIRLDRNIIPIFINNFNVTDLGKHLPAATAAQLQEMQGVRVHYDYFDAAMDKLRNHLSKPTTVTIVSDDASQSAFLNTQKAEIDTLPDVKTDTLKAEEWFQIAYEKVESGDYVGAVADYGNAIQFDASMHQAYHNRGIAYAGLGQYQQAIESYNQALQLEPSFSDAYVGRGIAYNELEQYDRSIKDYHVAIRLNALDANAYFGRGKSYSDLEQYETALPDFAQAIELNPTDLLFYEGRAIAYFYTHQYDAAIADCDHVLGLNPTHALAQELRDTAMMKRNEQNVE